MDARHWPTLRVSPPISPCATSPLPTTPRPPDAGAKLNLQLSFLQHSRSHDPARGIGIAAPSPRRRMQPMQSSNVDLWKGAVAELAAGLAATYVMTQFQNLSGKLEKA